MLRRSNFSIVCAKKGFFTPGGRRAFDEIQPSSVFYLYYLVADMAVLCSSLVQINCLNLNNKVCIIIFDFGIRENYQKSGDIFETCKLFLSRLRSCVMNPS